MVGFGPGTKSKDAIKQKPTPRDFRAWGAYPSGRVSAPSARELSEDIDSELISEVMYRQDAAQAAWDSLTAGTSTLTEALGDIATTIPRWSPLVQGTAIAAFLQHPGRPPAPTSSIELVEARNGASSPPAHSGSRTATHPLHCHSNHASTTAIRCTTR